MKCYDCGSIFVDLPRLGMFLVAASLLCACAAQSPILEGGTVSVETGREGKKEDLLQYTSVINLVEQLDPLRLCEKSGYSSPRSVNMELAPAVFKSAEPAAIAALKCAFEAFYSGKSYELLPEGDRAELRVNGVLTTYAERQLDKIKQIADSIDSSVQDGLKKQKDGVVEQSTYVTIAPLIRSQILQPQIDELYKTMPIASAQAPFIEYQRRRRNRVQSSVLTASDSACDAYRRNLNRLFSTTNYTFGSTSTIAGGLGAVATDLGTSRGLAAIAGIISGVRAEYNDAFFRNKVVELLTKAMDNARNRKKDETRRRQVQLISDYSVEEAVNDAIVYNSQCTLIAGLQEASESLQTVSDPGLRWMATAFGGAAADANLTQSLFTSLGGAVGTVQKIQKKVEDPSAPPAATSAPAPMPTSSSTPTPTPSSAAASAPAGKSKPTITK
jgi:hypothetical protein